MVKIGSGCFSHSHFKATLLRIDRFIAWLLFFIVCAYIITGFNMTGRYGFDSLMRVGMATKIHNTLCIPLVFLFLFHVVVHFYFSLIRWGMIRKKLREK